METEINFPLRQPTHYLACLNNFNVTHVAVKLSRRILLILLLCLYAPRILEYFNIVHLTFARRRKPGQISLLDNLRFYRYIGGDRIRPDDDRELSSDEDPYNCLTIGELASLGGFVDQQVLRNQFELIPLDNANPLGMTVCKTQTGMVFFKIMFKGEEYETEIFNANLLVQKYFALVRETSVKNVQEAKHRLRLKWDEHRSRGTS